MKHALFTLPFHFISNNIGLSWLSINRVLEAFFPFFSKAFSPFPFLLIWAIFWSLNYLFMATNMRYPVRSVVQQSLFDLGLHKPPVFYYWRSASDLCSELSYDELKSIIGLLLLIVTERKLSFAFELPESHRAVKCGENATMSISWTFGASL